MSGERPAQIAVVDDADAYLGVEQEIAENSTDSASIEEDGSTNETETKTTTEDTSLNETTTEDETTTTENNTTSSTTDSTTASDESGQTLELTVINRFSQDVTVEASLGEESASESLDTGDSHTFELESVECDETITIEATGSGVAAELERTVECD
jgi:cytoskeletal protein RodZ